MEKLFIEIPKGTKIKGVLSELEFTLKKGLKIHVKPRTVYDVDFDELDMHYGSYDLESLKKDIRTNLVFNYEEYALKDDIFLRDDTMKLKQKLLDLLEVNKCLK